jgi:hypothetical protein
MKFNIFSKQEPIFKYLFKAEFIDGSTFEQDPQDRSILEPEKRNSFYDFQQIKDKKLKRFSLSDGKNTIAVNLLSGRFEINGLELVLTPEQNLLKLRPEFELIYFKEKIEQTTFTMRGGVAIDKKDLPSYINAYFIGWKCKAKIKNDKNELIEKSYEQLLGIN